MSSRDHKDDFKTILTVALVKYRGKPIFRIFEVFQRVPALHHGGSKCSTHKNRLVGAYLEMFEAILRPWEPPEGRGT